jgi:cobalamin biosynthesis Mg chelatase CobN
MIRKTNLSSPARLALSSFVALLTLALAPALASAAIPQYEEAVANPCGSSCNPSKQHEGSAHSSKSPDGGGSTAPSETPSEPSESEKSSTSPAGSNSPGSGNGGGGENAGQGQAKNNPGNGSGNASPKASNLSQNTAKPSSGDDGGSSPLVPILIVVAILAAISLGVVWYRQRRQRPGSPSVSPKAG